MKTAVIYARYSSDSQSEQSIEGQLRVCQQFAKNNDIIILETYIDRAMTGTNDARPDFQRMIKDSNKRQWDYVIVYKLDRFSRNKYEATIHKHTLKENGIKILSAMENIPDTPEGIILESLLEGMNQYYSAELSQKVLRGLKESYLKGNFTGGRQIFGYDVKNKKNIINPTESEIVKEIFDKFAQGFTGVTIANDLRKRGIRNKFGNPFTEKLVYKIIENTKYNGKVKHGDTIYTNIYPAIIDDITWQKVQTIRTSNKHAPGRKKDVYEYILSSKLYCGECQRQMVGDSGTSHTGEKHYYYSCLSKRRKQTSCEIKSINKRYLEDIVINTTWKLLCSPETIKALAQKIFEQHQKATNQDTIIQALEGKRLSALKASKNLITAIEQGIITDQTKIRLKELETEISQLDFDIEQEKLKTYSFLTIENIEEYLNKVICGDIESMNTRKKIVLSFINKIILYKNKIIITYNFTDIMPKETTNLSIEEIEKQSQEGIAFYDFISSNKEPNSAPTRTMLNPKIKPLFEGLTLFFILPISKKII